MIYDAKNYTGTPERRCKGDTVRRARRGGDSPRRSARTAQRGYLDPQRQQGFDLEEYAGKKLTLYTYRITNHPDAEEADASLYVYRSELVGGDVHSTSFTGFMTALR